MAFPTYPANGQVTVLNGIQYTYTSATNSWSRNPTSPLLVTTSNAVSYTAATSPPASGPSLLPGALWYNTATDILYTYTYDGVNYVWVDEDSATVNVATGVTTYTGNNTTVVSGTLYINNAATTVGGNLNVSGNITTTGANIIATSGNIGFVNALFSGNNTVSGNLNITGNVVGNISNGIVTTVANSAASFGYLGVPQNTQTSSYTVVATDAGKQVYLSANANVTIPSNASLPFPIGTILTVITGQNITANILTGGDTFIYAGSAATGTRTMVGNSIASCFKTASTSWLITGAGVS
jgi:cytoskeletal protein CcmA (bactofilin family)